MEHRFQNLTTSPVFKHLIALPDVSTWTTDNLEFGDTENLEISENFQDKLHDEWNTLKTFVFPIIQNNKDECYVKVWQYKKKRKM